MVNCGRILTALLSFGFVSRGAASDVVPLNITHVPYIPIVREWDNGNGNMTVHYLSVLPKSPLVTQKLDLAKRSAITIKWSTVIASGSAIILTAVNSFTICKTIATEMNYRSTANECTLVYGTSQDGKKIEGYSYQATTTGSNCKTTAIYDTILAAVENCVDDLHAQLATTGCCKFRHGGSWTGHLRLSAMPEKHPVEDIVCNFSSD
jgi:hypothetical protein